MSDSKNILAVQITSWNDYELLDSGGQEKLEKFGKYIIARPEPQAVWQKDMPQDKWDSLCNAKFEKSKGVDFEVGSWNQKPGMPGQWKMSWKYNNTELKFRLGLTAFKHVGIFPEQSNNWEYIYDQVQNLKKHTEKPRVLNLFAYTGGASLAACAAGADVTHVDSVKQVINWSRENMENSGLDNIRWVVEDAFKYVEREVKRGKKYEGIILDPPAYGRGPDGEKWLLDKQINALVSMCSQLLEKGGFLVLNLYSMGYSALIAETLVKQHFKGIESSECGELYMQDSFGKKLPLGIFLRMVKKS